MKQKKELTKTHCYKRLLERALVYTNVKGRQRLKTRENVTSVVDGRISTLEHKSKIILEIYIFNVTKL